MVNHVVLDFLEEVGGKHEVAESLVGCLVYKFLITNPLAMSFINENDVFTDAKHGVHVVGVDDGRYLIFMGDIAQQLVDKDRCLRVETGVRLVAEKVFGIETGRNIADL